MKRLGSGQQLYGVFISCGIKIEGEKAGKNCWGFTVNLHRAAPGRGWGQGDKGTRGQGTVPQLLLCPLAARAAALGVFS